MNSRDRSLEDGPSIVTKAFPCISLVVLGHFNCSIGSMVEEVSVVTGDCEDRSKRSTFKGLFRNLQVVCRLMEGWIEYLSGYNL